MKIKTLLKQMNAPWLGTAAITAGAVFAAVNASLWQAAAFLPAFIVVAALAQLRRSQ
jgi:membrane protein implicated in regulation of membrane protease activity